MSTVTNAVEIVKIQAAYQKYNGNPPTMVYATGTFDGSLQAAVIAAGFPADLNFNNVYGITDGSLTVHTAKINEDADVVPQGLFFNVATEAAMLALSTAKVGAQCARSDTNHVFTLEALPASTIGNWTQTV